MSNLSYVIVSSGAPQGRRGPAQQANVLACVVVQKQTDEKARHSALAEE